MKKLYVVAMAALAASLTVGATPASAQSWGYDQYQADRSYQKAVDLRNRAHEDQRGGARR